MSEQQPVDPNLKFLMTDMEMKAICMLCTASASIVIAQAKEFGGDPKALTKTIDLEIDRLIKETIDRKILRNEIHKQAPQTIESRMAMFGVDPINEVLNLHYELFFIRYLFNVLVSNNEELKKIMNEETFATARQFANQEIKAKFPKVINTQELNQNTAEEKEEPKPDEAVV